MPAPASAASHYRRLQRLRIVTVLGARRIWSTMRVGADWERQYAQEVGPQLTGLLFNAQGAAVSEADLYVAEILNELHIGPTTRPGVVRPQPLVGVTGDGRPVETLLATSVGRARAIDSRLTQTATRTEARPAITQAQALADTQAFIDTVAASLIADANRAAETVALGQRPWVDGWVRMINPPCCSRCAVLAGRFYLFSEGFARHPNCDCYHAPAPSDPARLRALMDVNSPERYFESLTEAEQDKVFTRAGAQAIREGADIGRVVNARRGMSTSGATETQQRLIAGQEFTVNVRRKQAATRRVNGRDVFTTTEATTRRGRLPGQARGVRLMPESIFQIAGDDRDEAIRLLRLHGYIT